MILTLCHFFFIVYSLAFYEDEKFHSFYDKWLNFLIYTIPFDVLLKLNSGFFANGTPVEERRLIIKKYFQNDFFWDTLTFFVLLIQIIFEYKHKDNYNFYMHLLQIFYFSKYQIFEKIIQNVEEIISFDEKIEAFISLIKLFFKLLFFAHLVACIWYALGKSSELNQTTWLENFSGKSETFKYLVSLYWAITTISTIGYGDITPCNEKEYLFSLIVMILGSMFFGYSLTYMGGIFDQLQKEEVLKRLAFLF